MDLRNFILSLKLKLEQNEAPIKASKTSAKFFASKNVDSYLGFLKKGGVQSYDFLKFKYKLLFIESYKILNVI